MSVVRTHLHGLQKEPSRVIFSQSEHNFRMSSNQSTSDRFPWAFFGLAFAFSWLVWLPAILANVGVIKLPLEQYANAFLFVGVFGPMFGACVCVYREKKWSGLRGLLGSLLKVRFHPAWWMAIVLLPIAIQAVAHFLPFVVGGPIPPRGTSSAREFISTFALVTLLGGGQEEIGWRGYALDRIQSQFNALTSSVLLGAIWALWHLPLWFMPGTSLRFAPIGSFVIGLLSLSVILTWIYNNTGRSAIAATLTHGMSNAAHTLFPIFIFSGTSQPVYSYWAVISAIAAVAIVLMFEPKTLTTFSLTGRIRNRLSRPR